MNFIRHSLVVGLLATGLAACKRDEAPTPIPSEPAQSAPAQAQSAPSAATPVTARPEIAEVQLARAVGEDMRATEPTMNFKPADAIYAIVMTEGVGSAELGARWTYGANRQPVYQEQHRIDATGPGVHNFRITKADGFPAGNYRVEITLDGVVAATRDFKVE